MESLAVRPPADGDHTWADTLITSALGDRRQARLDELIDPLALPGVVAVLDGSRVGLVTFLEGVDDIEIVAIASSAPRRGVGTALIDAATRRAGRSRLWLVTTNDNLDALRF